MPRTELVTPPGAAPARQEASAHPSAHPTRTRCPTTSSTASNQCQTGPLGPPIPRGVQRQPPGAALEGSTVQSTHPGRGRRPGRAGLCAGSRGREALRDPGRAGLERPGSRGSPRRAAGARHPPRCPRCARGRAQPRALRRQPRAAARPCCGPPGRARCARVTCTSPTTTWPPSAAPRGAASVLTCRPPLPRPAPPSLRA